MKPQRLALKQHQLMLLVVLAVGFGLRLLHLGSMSYWLDEAISLSVAKADLNTLLTNVAGSSHPPLYYLALRAWLALGLGSSEAPVRLLSALLSTGAIAAVYLLAQEMFDRHVALCAALLMALAPFQIVYAQEVRMYALVALLAPFTLWAFLRAWRSNQAIYWLAFALGSAACIYTHYFCGLLVAAVHLFALLQWRQLKVRWKGLLAADLVVALLFLPQLTLFLQKLGAAGGTRWGSQPMLTFVPVALVFLILGYSVPQKMLAVGMFVMLALVVLILYQNWKRWKRYRTGERQALMLLVCVIFPPLLGLGLFVIFRPFFAPKRILMFAVSSYIILLAQGLLRAPRRSPLPILYGLLAGLVVASLAHYYFNSEYTKPPLREATAFIAQRSEPGDIEVHISDGSYLPRLHYPQTEQTYLLRGDPGTRKSEHIYGVLDGQLIGREEAIDRPGRIWLVVFVDHSPDYQIEAAQWFQVEKQVLEKHDIEGIKIYLLDASAP